MTYKRPRERRDPWFGVSALAGLAALTVAALGTVLLSPDGGLEAGSKPSSQPSDMTNRVPAADLNATEDKFGIKQLYESQRDGTLWVSDWSTNRAFSGADPQDPWFDSDHGSARYKVVDGTLRIAGDTPRMYVHDPKLKRQWQDVEITVYAMRRHDDNVPYTGITAVARSNHLNTEEGSFSDPCDTRGYGGRFRFDGKTDFEKETKHPDNDTASEKVLWPDGMPRDVWIGFKYVVYDRSDGVHLELYRDMSDGYGGGNWEKVNSFVDTGDKFGVVPCAGDVDPMMKLTASGDRKGSESNKPNLSVYFRSDGINGYGLWYKWASVREINP